MDEIEHGTPSAYSYHRCRCEVCVEGKRARDRAYYIANKDRVKAKVREYHEANRAEVLAQQAEYRARNKNQIAARRKAYYEANAEAIKAKSAKWAKDNPERAKAHAARFRENHREEIREASLAYYRRMMETNPERVRSWRREWAKTQKGVLANRAARTARRGAAYTQEAKDWIASLVDPLCAYCGEAATEIDHIIPISKGGTGELSNLAPACRSCNARKNDKESF